MSLLYNKFMDKRVSVFDPTLTDKLSQVRGIGRYLQILKENFSKEFNFVNNLTMEQLNNETVFINPFFNFLQPPLTLKRVAKKQIAVIHDLITLKYPAHFPAGVRGNINILLNKIALKNYDFIITDSYESKKDIVNILGLPDNKIKVIYPCLPQSFLKLKIENSIPIKSGENFCLYVGDATWNKNLVNIAKAIKIANVTAVFVGKVFILKSRHLSFSSPWQKELKEFSEMTKNDQCFIFTGFIPDSEIFKLYKQASVNLLISKDEGFGFSYVEAANFSCPSLLADIPVLKEISKNQALFADPKNPRDMADKINEIYFNKNLRNKLGDQAKKRSEFFSSKKFKKEFLSVI
jgi:glycosyltransferase involved in cell wall biosynthesis